MACVKNARAFNTPNHLDSHVDAVNYELFAATFAQDYAMSRQQVQYKTRNNLKTARTAKLAVVDDKPSDSAVVGESA